MPGLIHIYCGDGKGKTTAAIGLAVRAAGAGKRVAFIQLLKGRATAELKPLESLGVTVLRAQATEKFAKDMTAAELAECRQSHLSCMQAAQEYACGGYDMVVIDEIFAAIALNMVDENTVATIIMDRAKDTEIVLTGREPSERMLGLADYVSNIQKVKHPYDEGVAARYGIEF